MSRVSLHARRSFMVMASQSSTMESRGCQWVRVDRSEPIPALRRSIITSPPASFTRTIPATTSQRWVRVTTEYSNTPDAVKASSWAMLPVPLTSPKPLWAERGSRYDLPKLYRQGHEVSAASILRLNDRNGLSVQQGGAAGPGVKHPSLATRPGDVYGPDDRDSPVEHAYRAGIDRQSGDKVPGAIERIQRPDEVREAGVSPPASSSSSSPSTAWSGNLRNILSVRNPWVSLSAAVTGSLSASSL